MCEVKKLTHPSLVYTLYPPTTSTCLRAPPASIRSNATVQSARGTMSILGRGGGKGGGGRLGQNHLVAFVSFLFPPKPPRPAPLSLSLCLHVAPAPVGAGGRRQPPPTRANVFKDQCPRSQGQWLAGQAAVRDDGASGAEGGGGEHGGRNRVLAMTAGL